MTLTAGVRIMADCRNCKHYNYSESKEGKYYTIHMSCKVFNGTKPMMTSLDCTKYSKVTFNELL